MFSAMLVLLVLAQPQPQGVRFQCPNGQCPNMQCPNMQCPNWGGWLVAQNDFGPVAKDAEKVLLSPEDRREAHEAELRRRKYLVWQRKAAEAAVRRQYIALSNSWGYQSPYIWVPSPPQPPDLYILPPVYSHR